MPPGSDIAAAAPAAAFAVSNPLGWATLGASILSGLFGGSQDQSNIQAQIDLQRQLGNFGLDTQGVGAADQLFRQAQTQPIRDKVMFALQNRLSQSPGQFRPNDLFNGGTAGGAPPPGSQGGINLNTLQQQMQGYTPGAGGAGTPDMYRQMLGRLGYGLNAPPDPFGGKYPKQRNDPNYMHDFNIWKQQNYINPNVPDFSGANVQPVPPQTNLLQSILGGLPGFGKLGGNAQGNS